MKPERVTFAATANADGRTLSGVAHAFGQRTLRGGRYIEFAPGAFDAALARADVRAFVNHNSDLLLGRQSNGTVGVESQPDGLHYRIDVPETTYGNDLLTVVGRGDLKDMSFGIVPGRYQLSKAPDGKQIVTHTQVEDLFDVSPVSMPAFAGTSVALASMFEENDYQEPEADDAEDQGPDAPVDAGEPITAGAEPLASQLVRARYRAQQGVHS